MIVMKEDVLYYTQVPQKQESPQAVQDHTGKPPQEVIRQGWETSAGAFISLEVGRNERNKGSK